MRTPTDAEATEFIEASDFVWHQSFPLSENVWAPGVNLVADLFARSTIPASLEGLSVLDIGTTNGAAAFEAERRGASRVVAVDICDDRHYGFGSIAALLDSKVEFVTSTVYEIDSVLDEQFDIVILWGVLYHLRHPLLGLDAVRRVSRGLMTLETVVNDATDGDTAPLARFHRLDDLGGDGTNWWSPSTTALCEWIASAGFDVTSRSPAPADGAAERIVVDAIAVVGDPEYRHVSYELPLRVTSPLAPPTEPPSPVTLDDLVALRASIMGDASRRHLDDEARLVAGQLADGDLPAVVERWIDSDQFVTTWATNRTFRRVQGGALRAELEAFRPIVRMHSLAQGPDVLDVALASLIDPTLVQVGRTLDQMYALPLDRLLSLRLISGVHGHTMVSLLHWRDPIVAATVLDPIAFHVTEYTAGRLDGTITESTGFEQWLLDTRLPRDPQCRRLAIDATTGSFDPGLTEPSLDRLLASITLLAPSGAEASVAAAITDAAHLPTATVSDTPDTMSAGVEVSERARDLIAELAPLDAALHRAAIERWR